MGLKNWFKKAQEKISDKIDSVKNSETFQEKKQDVIEKTTELAGKAIVKGAEIKEKVEDAADAIKQKADAIIKAQEGKPTTGSSLLDFLTPAVPKKEEPKKAAPKKRKPKGNTPDAS
jgi:hypothetical protein